MPITEHVEKHFAATESVRDVVIGMSDGLTVPFALAAGLTGSSVILEAHEALRVIVMAGLAEVAAGSIAMGLGGYLAAKTDREHYFSERAREEREVVEKPEHEAAEVEEVFEAYGLSREQIKPIIDAMRANPKMWVEFMMRFELGLEEPNPRRALISALTIAGSYIVGGLIPLSPYILGETEWVPAMANPNAALGVSIGITLLALLIFGTIKGKLTGVGPVRGGFYTMLIGGLAAAAAFGIAWLVGAG